MLPPLPKRQRNITAVCDGNSDTEKKSDDDYMDRKMPTVYETKQKGWHTYDEPETQKFHGTRPRPPPQKGNKITNPCVRCQTCGETCYAQGKKQQVAGGMLWMWDSEGEV